MMHEAPHLESGDIDELEKVLRDSDLPADNGNLFDEESQE